MKPLATPAGWRRAAPWLPAIVRPGRVYVGDAGEVLRVDELGHLDVVHQGASPFGRSIASNPDATWRGAT